MGILLTLVFLVAGNDGPMDVSVAAIVLMVGIIAIGTTIMVLLLIANSSKPKNKPPRTIERDGVKYWTYND